MELALIVIAGFVLGPAIGSWIIAVPVRKRSGR